MTEKEYIDRLTNLIFNRVKFHSPKVSKEVDFALLDVIGIDAKYPIFVYSKPLDKVFLKAFSFAKKMCDFNLVLTEYPKVRRAKVKTLDKTYLLPENETGAQVKDVISSLNINYKSHSKFNLESRGEYLKVKNRKIDFEFKPFYYFGKIMNEGIIYEIKNYILNGKNYMVTISNTTRTLRTAEFEFNLPLPRGYYIFKRLNNYIEIENLTSKDKAYFNFNIKNAEISFSMVDGIENCTFAGINLKCKIPLLSKETRKVYFNFGENKYCLFSPRDMNTFFEISQHKMNEIFDIQVVTKDKGFDYNFNCVLPQKIWENWAKFGIDENSENLWLKSKALLVKNDNLGFHVREDFKGLKEVKVYKDKKWKRVFIVHNNAKYLFADNVKYFNFTLITKEIFAKNDEIYLSFND